MANWYFHVYLGDFPEIHNRKLLVVTVGADFS